MSIIIFKIFIRSFNMGCTYDVINVKLNNLNDAVIFINIFNQVLKNDFYFKDFKVEDDSIEDNGSEVLINIEGEPLFAHAEGVELCECLIKEFVRIHPTINIQLDYSCTYSNCGEALYAKFDYCKSNIINVKIISADYDGIFWCEECDEEFEEALLYIEDYEDGKTCICPNCGATLSLNAYINKYQIKI